MFTVLQLLIGCHIKIGWGSGCVVTQTQRIFFYLGPHSYGISSVSASNSPSVSLSPPSTPSSNTCIQVHNYNYKCAPVLLFSSTPSSNTCIQVHNYNCASVWLFSPTPSSNTCIQVHTYSHTSPSLSPSSLSTPSSNTWYKYATTLSTTITHGSDCIKGRKHFTTAGKQQPQLNLMVITGRIPLSVLSVFYFMSVHSKVILGDPFEYLHWNQPSNSSAVCSLMTSLAFLQTPSTIIQFLSLRT